MGPTSAPALADGDPASDVLASQALFLPWDAGVSASEQARLTALLAAAADSGYPIRAALIASSSDLGSVTALWRRPQEYAEFLGEELSLVYHGPLLVIMPNGFGFFQGEHTSGSPWAALAGIPISSTGSGLTRAATLAVQRLAASSGHRLSVPRTAAPLRAAASAAPWIVFAVGWALIALAWAASLHARPPRIRSTRASRYGT